MTYFLIAAGGVFIGYMLRAIECKAQAQRVSLEPWIDDDTEGLTID